MHILIDSVIFDQISTEPLFLPTRVFLVTIIYNVYIFFLAIGSDTRQPRFVSQSRSRSRLALSRADQSHRAVLYFDTTIEKNRRRRAA